mmetsp:Transcript_13863/g.18110  ORF Transcript_13863/g.18110 Transcript_13863/m.18110 type:complete len:608 (+) Transcript_13863:122-1945(+)
MDSLRNEIDSVDSGHLTSQRPRVGSFEDSNFESDNLGEDILNGIASFLDLDRDEIESNEQEYVEVQENQESSRSISTDPSVNFIRGLGKLIKKGIEKGEKRMKQGLDERLETIKGRIREHRDGVLKRQSNNIHEKAQVKEESRNRFISEDKRIFHGGPVAKLIIRNMQIRNMPNYAKNHPFLTLAVERYRNTTSRTPSQSNKWEDEFEIEIHDISADIVVSLYGKGNETLVAVPDTYLGKVIVPMSRLYRNESILEWFSKSKKVFEFQSWFQVYPVKESQRYFEAVVPGLPGTGMDRPKTDSLGEIFMSFRLELNDGFSLANAFTHHGPFKPIGVRQANLDSVNPAMIKMGVERLKCVKQNALVWKNGFMSLQSWKQPSVSACVTLWWTYSCLSAPAYQYPCLFVLFFIFFNVAFQQEHCDEIILWNDEIVKDPSLPDTIPKKLRLLQKILVGLQKLTNMASFHLERIQNSSNFADRVASTVFFLMLFVFSLLLSALLKLAELLFSYVVPFHILVYLIGLQLLVPLPLSAIKLTPPSSEEAADSKAESNNTPNENVKSIRNRLRTWREKAQLSLLLLSRYIRHIFARIPDSNEIMHRKIARTQELVE